MLFPIVGRVWDNVYRTGGGEHSLGQHVFARDMGFAPGRWGNGAGLQDYSSARDRISGQANEVWFQIGAHPAFLYPEFCPDDPVHGYFTFGDVKEFDYILVKEKGCADTQTRHHLHLPDGRLPLNHHVFDAATAPVTQATSKTKTG